MSNSLTLGLVSSWCCGKVRYWCVNRLVYFKGGLFNAKSDEGTLRRSLFEHTGGSYPEVRILVEKDCR